MSDEEKNLIQFESRIHEEFYVKLYDSVLFDTRLSGNEVRLLCFYIKVGGSKKFSWYKLRDIAKLLNLSPNTIRSANKNLCELGYIETVFQSVSSPYKIIVNEIQQINGFDIIRSNFEEGSKTDTRSDAKNDTPVTQKVIHGDAKNDTLKESNIKRVNEREKEKERNGSLSLFEEFEKDYLNYYAKITARTYSDINLLLKKPIDRDDFKTIFENAKYLHESGYHWRKGMEMIYNDLDKTKTPTQAYFEFRDELRLMLRDDAETIKKRKQASVNKVKSETVENMEYDEEVEAIKRQSQKIPKEASQNLVKKLSEYYKLE